MASVPEPTGPRVLPGGDQLPYQSIRANPDAFGAPIARGLGAVAGATEGASDMLNQHALVLQGLDNKAKSDEAAISATQAANELYTKYTLDERGAKALPAYDSYVADMNKVREEGRTGLASPMARQMYDTQTRQVMANLAGSMSRFAAGEQKKYVEQTSISLESNAADLMTLHPGDKGLEEQYLATSARETRFRALNAGLDAGEDTTNTDRMLKDNRGKVYATVALNLAVTDPNGAQDYLEGRKDLMDPQAYAAAQMRLKPAVMANDAANDAQGAVGEVLGTVSTTAPPSVAKDPKAFFGALGATITSGVRTPEHNAEVGGVTNSEHLAANGTAYDLVPKKGETTAQFATRLRGMDLGAHQILDEGDHVHIGWRAGSVDSMSGGAQTSAQLQGQMESAIAKAGAAAEKRYPGNAVYRNQVEAQAYAFLNRRISSAKDVEGSATIGLLNTIDAGNIQDMGTLMKTAPETVQQYNALPPSGRAAVDMAMRRNGNELTLARQQALTTYTGLWANRNNDPQAFLSADINSMDLRTSDRQTALKQQMEFRAKPTAMVDKPFNSIVQSPEFKSVLGTLGIKTSEKGLQTPDYSHLLGAVSAELDDWRAKNPSAFPDQKAQAGILARATAAQGTYRNTFLGVPYGAPKPITEGDYADVGGAKRAFDVTPEDRKGAIGYLQSQGLPVDEMSIAKVVHDARGTP